MAGPTGGADAVITTAEDRTPRGERPRRLELLDVRDNTSVKA
jgi:hypothetical protein